MINKKISIDSKNNLDVKTNTIREEMNQKKKQNIQNQESAALGETEKNKKLSYNFTVAVRVKPKIGDTEKSNNQNLLSYSDINSQTLILEYPSNKKQSYNYCSKNRKFTFDNIFIDRDNRAIYENLIQSKLNVLKQNMNLTLLTYGITGSGKTHTIFGNKDMKQSGLAMMVFEDVIRNHSQQSSEFHPVNNNNKTQFMFSYMQIYNEQVHDLLKCEKYTMADNLQDKQSIPQLKLKSLSVFQDSCGKVVIPQLSKIKVYSIENIQELVERGNAIRACSSNLINKLSSRSHAILQLYCVQKQTKIQNIVTIIDLAGSERHIATSLINGVREKSKQKENQNLQKQGSNINRSLLALGNCLKGLQNGQTHIPYRDSKLTRILKEDLSGKSHNIMIACVGRNLSQADQTVNTLQYATRAVNIKVEKVKNTAKNVGLECMHCYKLTPWSFILQKLPQQLCLSRNAKQNDKQINRDCQRESEMKKMLKKTPQFLTPNLQKNLQLSISEVFSRLKKDILELVNSVHREKDIQPLFKQDDDFYKQFRKEGQVKQVISRGVAQVMAKYQKIVEIFLVEFYRQTQVKMKAFYQRDQKTNKLKYELYTIQMQKQLKIENQLEEKQQLRCEKQKNWQLNNQVPNQGQDRMLRESFSSIQLQASKQKRLKNKNNITLNGNCDFVAEYRQYNNIGKKMYIKNKYEGLWKGSSASTMNSNNNNFINSSYDDAMNIYRNRVKTQRMNPDIDAEPDSSCNGSKSLIIKKLKEAKRDTCINQLERMHQNCSRIQLQNEIREDRSIYAKDSFLYINKRKGITPNKNHKFSQVNNYKSNIDGLIKIRQCQMEEEIEVSSFREDSISSFHPQTFKKQVETFI